MKRVFSFVSLFLMCCLLFSTVHVSHAQSSLLPTTDELPTTLEGDSKHIKNPENCIELRNLLAVYPNPADLEGKYLLMKLQCGRMMLGDITYYARHMLQFFFDILGTLAVIAVIRAGYMYMLSQDKNFADGKKVVRQVAIGIAIALFSFTAVRFLFSFVLSFGG